MSKCILVVDDNVSMRTATRRFLEAETSFRVCGEAVDGFDAIEKTSHLNPDLIVLDFEMPRMNGLQAALKLRAMKVYTPIILFTMYADAVPSHDAAASDINVVISKSDTAGLRRHVESLLVNPQSSSPRNEFEN
jgi:DNA-binding NarL/FixJ family response regulator